MSVVGDWIDSFYSADNLQTKDETSASINSINATTVANLQRFGYLKNGQWLQATSSASSWNIQTSPTSFQEIIYPSGSLLPISTELGTADYAITSSFSCTGKTPVPNRVA